MDRSPLYATLRRIAAIAFRGVSAMAAAADEQDGEYACQHPRQVHSEEFGSDTRHPQSSRPLPRLGHPPANAAHGERDICHRTT